MNSHACLEISKSGCGTDGMSSSLLTDLGMDLEHNVLGSLNNVKDIFKQGVSSY